MSSSIRLANDLEGFQGTAPRLTLANSLVWPEQIALVSLSPSAAPSFCQTWTEPYPFLLVSSDAVDPPHAPIGCLARVLGWHIDSDRVVLALRGICQARVASTVESWASRDAVAVSLMPDTEAEPRLCDHEYRRQEILEAAAHWIPGPLPLAVTSYLLDKIPLGALCDLIRESVLHEPPALDRSTVEARSEDILNALRERRGSLRASTILENGLPPFSRN